MKIEIEVTKDEYIYLQSGLNSVKKRARNHLSNWQSRKERGLTTPNHVFNKFVKKDTKIIETVENLICKLKSFEECSTI